MAAQFLEGFGRPPGVLARRDLVPTVRPASGPCRTPRRSRGVRDAQASCSPSERLPSRMGPSVCPPRAARPPGGCQQCGRRWSAGRLPAFWSQLARRGQVTQPVWPTVLIMHGDRGEWRRWPARLSDGAQHVASAGQGCRAPRGPRLCPEPFSSPCQKRKVASP